MIILSKWAVAEIRDAQKNLNEFLKDTGGCDHSVGICYCDVIRNIERLDDILRANLLRSIRIKIVREPHIGIWD